MWLDTLMIVGDTAVKNNNSPTHHCFPVGALLALLHVPVDTIGGVLGWEAGRGITVLVTSLFRRTVAKSDLFSLNENSEAAASESKSGWMCFLHIKALQRFQNGPLNQNKSTET